jgi:hypothetical protein
MVLYQICVFGADLKSNMAARDKIKIHVSENFEFRHFRPHYLDVDTIFGDLGVNACSKKYHI